VQREIGKGGFDVHSAKPGPVKILFPVAGDRASIRPEQAMKNDINGDEVGCVVVVGHVNGEASLWKVATVQVEQLVDPCEAATLYGS
jgi:hypothetical protein